LVLNGNSTLQLNLGDGLILVAAALRGVMVVATKKLIPNASISTLSLTAVQMGVVAMGALVMVFLVDTGLPNLQTLPSSFWWAIAYLVSFCTLFAFFAQNYGVRHTSPSRAALLMGTEPAFGGLFAVLWLGEALSNIQLVGAFLVVTAALAGARR
jgi:drug/metabolite transporter (DMT)-like permease